MAQYIKKIRTESGDLQIDYNALANLPDPVTVESIGAATKTHTHTPQSIGAAQENHTHTLEQLGAANVNHTHTPESIGAAPAKHTHAKEEIDAAPSNHTHTAEDIGAAPADHTHTAADIGAATADHTHSDYAKVPLHRAVTIVANNWSDVVPYAQTIVVEGVSETDMPHVSPVYDDDIQVALAQKDAWAMVSRGKTSANAITFYCFEGKPAVDIQVQIEVNR